MPPPNGGTCPHCHRDLDNGPLPQLVQTPSGSAGSGDKPYKDMDMGGRVPDDGKKEDEAEEENGNVADNGDVNNNNNEENNSLRRREIAASAAENRRREWYDE